ncbi:hypothetical protein [Streptomyces sp. NPDC006971]
MNIGPLLNALDLQEDAARALADELRTQIDDVKYLVGGACVGVPPTGRR